MQVSQVDISSNRIGEEDSINFRPSPNFKNMKFFKKIIINNYEENEFKNGNALILESIPPSDIEKNEAKKEVQPPLPLDPPPNDYIDTKNILKTSVGNGQFPEEKTDAESLKGILNNTPRETICRDFNRGSCNRVACKYAHIYIFCHEYQSKTCVRARCGFVHATVFEEQEYYRTNYLPPHVFARKTFLLPPPPPPPPKAQVPPQTNKENVIFNMPPPPLHNESKAISCETDKAVKVQPSAIIPPTSLASLVQRSPKREWNLIENNNTACEVEADKQATKKCKQCTTMEFRYQFNKDKLEKMKQSKEEILKKIAILDKNTEKLNTFIQAILIHSLSKHSRLKGQAVV